MTPRERVLDAIQFRDTDIVPYHVTFTKDARRNLADYYGDPDFESKIGNHFAYLYRGGDGVWTDIAPGYVRDAWDVVWNRTVDKDIGCVENRILPEPTTRGWEPPTPDADALGKLFRERAAANQDKFRIVSLGFALFERAWSLRGMEQLLMDMFESPDFVHDLFGRITEYNLQMIDIALHEDVDCVRFGDDWGSQHGLIMGPALWREFVKPYIARMYKRVRDAGKYVMIHSCGDVKEVFPDLVEIGLNIFNPFQPEVMDVFETKRKYYGQLSFFGGISVQRLLPLGTPDEVRRETRRLLWELGKGGGYIATPSHDIPSDVPAENMAAMLEVLQNQA